jgi:hypothetical protein
MAVAVAWAVRLAVRERDVMPVLVCAGGLIAVINEPIWDLLGRIVYAGNQPILYTSFGGRQIPVFLIPGYVVWVSVLGLLYSRLMARGMRPATLYMLATASFLSVAIIETLGNSSKMWTYYGAAPAKFLVVAPQMAPVPAVCGFLIFQLRPHLRGMGKLIYLAVPGSSLAAIYAFTSWPIYYALNSRVPTVWNWIASGAGIGLCAGVVWMISLPLAQDQRQLSRAAARRTVATAR